MLTFVLGTRPEAVKTRPVILEAKRRKLAFRVILTGQHRDLLMGTGVKADLHLGVPSLGDPQAYVAQAVESLWKHVQQPQGPVVVQGDTASALAGAVWGQEAGVPVVHIEAGLRSGDVRDPWPEEEFRIAIDRLSTLRCCPTPLALQNLEAEDLREGNVVTGNTITDHLRLAKAVRQPPRDLVLVTLHRRESFGQPFHDILTGLSSFAADHPDLAILWPLHPNPEVLKALSAVRLPVNILTRPPLPPKNFLTLLCHSRAVLTDSGGVSEETTTLGIPTALARDHTERPEAITSGVCRLAGKTPEGIERALTWSLDAAVQPSTTFGDGHASVKILDSALSYSLTPMNTSTTV